jgi:hypothetical protein
MNRSPWILLSMAAVLPGCEIHGFPSDSDSHDFSLCGLFWQGTPTRDGNVVFAYVFSRAPLSRPMASGGAHTILGVCSDDGQVVSVESTNPSVVSVTEGRVNRSTS